MPKLSRRATDVKPSPTIAMNARAAEMKRLGRDVIPLSLGEPDFHTPDAVKAAGIKAIENNFTKYTAHDGYMPLRTAIAKKLRDDNGATYAPEQIVVGGGAKVMILAAIMSVVDPGDEVLIPTPYWVTYPDQVELFGGVPIYVPSDDTTGFKVTPERLRAKLSPASKAFIFNSPNNPSGAVYSSAEIKALAAVLRDYPSVWIITDELYEHLVFDGVKTATFAGAAPELIDRTITINGFSKGYVMTGFRLAFAAGSRLIVGSISDFLSQMTGAPNSIAQAAAIAALEGDQEFLVENRRILQARRNIVVERINQIAGLSAIRPAGTFYVYVNCSGWLGCTSGGGRSLAGDLDVVEALLEESQLACVPGSVFGLSPYFRVSISLETAMLEAAMERLATFARDLV